MKYYFIASIRITSQEHYQEYLDRVDEVFEKFNGEYLAVDESPALIEGKWEYSKCVLIKFPSKEDFEKWYYSDEYQEIIKLRLSASEGDAILVQGYE